MFLKLSLRLLFGAAILAVALAAQTAHAQTATLNVTATVAQACTVSAPTALAFGTWVSGQSNPKDAEVNITFNCGTGINVRLDLSDGQNPGGGGIRQMGLNGGAASILAYQLYKDTARTQVWRTGADGKSDSGSGAAKQVPVYGRIPASQPGLGASTGNFTDQITVTLNVL